MGVRCCSLAQRGRTGIGFRGIWFGNAMLFPRKARSYRAWLSRDLIWDCSAVPSRSEVVQRLGFRGIWFGNAMLFPRAARSYRAWISRDLVWECDAVPSRSEVLQGLDFAGFGLRVQCCSLAQRGPTKAECRTAVSAGFGLGVQCCSLAQPGPTKVIVGPRFPRDLVWECNAVPSRSEVLQGYSTKFVLTRCVCVWRRLLGL